MKFSLHNSDYKDADVVILGVPDESGSRSKRKRGVAKAPDYIRKVSNSEDRFGNGRNAQSQSGLIKKKVFDAGNIKINILSRKIEKIIKDKKIPVVLGGDHSITSHIIKGIDKTSENIAFVYFDAHPDYRCSAGHYFGSVVCEISKHKNVKTRKSVLVGARVPEEEELENIKKSGLLVITPFDIEEQGVKNIFDKIKKRVRKTRVYLSIDMDVVDFSQSPGVDTPVPGGLSSLQLIYLVKKIASLGLIGIDLTEVNPKYDIQKMTGHLASRTIAEILGSLK